MLKPIHKSSARWMGGWESRELSSASPCNQMRYRSRMAHGKRSSFDPKKRLILLCNRVWEFIKVHLLFCCFDREKVKEKRDLKQLDAFIELYNNASSGNEGVTEEMVRSEFDCLSTTLREGVCKKILEIYKRECPNESEDFYEQRMKDQLQQPLKPWEKLDGSGRVYVYAEACLQLRNEKKCFD